MKLFQRQNSQQPRRRQGENLRQPEGAYSEQDNTTFRRNRTLTGSVSSRIVAVNETGADMKSARVHAHELTGRRRHIGALLLGVCMVSVVLFGLISQFTAKVIVKAEEVSVLDESYEKAVQSYLMAHPAERLRFLLNTTQLTQYLQSKTPEVSLIKSVEWKEFGSSEFSVVMREPNCRLDDSE